MKSSPLARRQLRNHARYRGRNDLNIVPIAYNLNQILVVQVSAGFAIVKPPVPVTLYENAVGLSVLRGLLCGL